MESPEPEVPIEAQKSDGALDQRGHHLTQENPVEQETEVAEPLQVPLVPPPPRPMVLEQPLPHILPMPTPMPFHDTLPKVPDQPIPYQGLITPRPYDIRLLGTSPGYDNDIDDEKQPEVSIKQPDKTIYLPGQLEINKFQETLKRKVINDNDIPISSKELSAECEKSPFFKDIYRYITKGHILSQIRGHALRKLKTECEDFLVIDDVLFRIKVKKDKSIEHSLLLVMPETYVSII